MGSYLAAKTWGALLREEALGRNLFLMSQGHGQGIHASALTPGNKKEKRWAAQILSNNYYVYRRVFFAKYWLPDILTIDSIDTDTLLSNIVKIFPSINTNI